MRRRFLRRKESYCPAIILFRYSDREIRIFEDKDDDENEDEPLVSESRLKLYSA